jgi:hypothetical protein
MGFLKGMFGQPKIKDGLNGKATVLAVPQPWGNASSHRIEMKLSVQLPDQDAYLAQHTCFASREKYPWPGTVLPVTVDRNDHERLRIEWDEVPTSDDRVAQSHEQMITKQGGPSSMSTEMGNVIDARNDPELRSQILDALSAKGVDVTHLSGDSGTPRPTEQEDTLDRLRQLGELRDTGVLTQEEFEIQKKRILSADE